VREFLPRYINITYYNKRESEKNVGKEKRIFRGPILGTCHLLWEALFIPILFFFCCCYIALALFCSSSLPPPSLSSARRQYSSKQKGIFFFTDNGMFGDHNTSTQHSYTYTKCLNNVLLTAYIPKHFWDMPHASKKILKFVWWTAFPFLRFVN
jgi:hypothetical protein